MINKVQVVIFALLMMAQMPLVNAADSTDKKSFRSAEVDKRSIRLAEDGTGIIDDFSCVDCGFKVLKVGSGAAGYLGDVNISVADLIKQSKADVGIVKYAVNSNTVYEIRFSH